MPVLFLLLLALTGTAVEPTAMSVVIGRGSGVLLPGGRVLTCHHVVEDVARPWAPACTVRLADGRELAARLVGTDPVGDLSLVALVEPPADLAAATLAEDADLRPGREVIAVGNPFGLADWDDHPSVTFGVLSTGIVARGAYPVAVLSDAPVNPGNSGGGLFLASNGALAGINGQIRTRTGFAANSGIAIAIAAPQIRTLLPALAQGTVARASLAEEVRDGPDGPVDAAGVRISAVGGVPVVSAAGVRAAVLARVWNPALKMEFTTPAGPRPARLQRQPLPGTPCLGWTLEDRGGRVVVAATDYPSPARMTGLPAGATLLSIDGAVIRTRLEVLRATAPRGVGERLAIVWRGPDGTEGHADLEVGWR